MPPNQPSARSRLFNFLLTFAIVYLATTTVLKTFFPGQFGRKTTETPPPISITAPTRTVAIGRDFFVQVRNATATGIVLPDHCPEPPVIIERKIGETLAELDLNDPAVPCAPLLELPPHSTTKIDLSPWKYAAFSEPGTYTISLPDCSPHPEWCRGSAPPISLDIRVKQPGFMVALFRAFISKPLFNGLVLIASLLPGHSLGLAILILTVIVKLILLLPSQHALESQKKMQALQPKIEEIKRRHGGNRQKMTEETMALWKREKINPMQSFLPTLLQLPVLIGLFFIIRDSGSIELARHLLYPPFLNLDWTFTTNFLGILDLKAVPFAGITWMPTVQNAKILASGGAVPLILAAMQFLQMKMAFTRKKDGKDKRGKPLAERLDAQTMMLFMLPVMIFFIAGTLPIAVSLYWGASTLFSIGQQLIVNRGK